MGSLDGRTRRGLSPKGSGQPTLFPWQRRVNGAVVMLILSTWSAIGQMLDRQRSFCFGHAVRDMSVVRAAAAVPAGASLTAVFLLFPMRKREFPAS